jgi:hypothetical protein
MLRLRSADAISTRAGRRTDANNNNARLWHPWLRINRVLRVMLHTRWSAEAWAQVHVEFTKALALRSEIRRAEWFAKQGRGEWRIR